MKTRTISKHKIGAIGFGGMSLGAHMGVCDRATALATLDAAWDAGITHFDTANIYGMGLSEEAIGEWLTTRGHQVHLATKASIVPGPPRGVNNSPAYLRQSLEDSLRRLKRDHVELFYIHRREIERPLEEVIETLSDLIREGKIGGYGLSEVSPATLRQAHAIVPCDAVQNEYSIWVRQPEMGLVQACSELGVALVAFSPLGRGILSDTNPLPFPDAFRAGNPRFNEPNLSYNLGYVAKLQAFAQSRGWKTAALAIAWLLHKAPHIVPIPGTRLASHLADWQNADQISLSTQDMAELEQLLPIGFAAGARYAPSHWVGVEHYC